MPLDSPKIWAFHDLNRTFFGKFFPTQTGGYVIGFLGGIGGIDINSLKPFGSTARNGPHFSVNEERRCAEHRRSRIATMSMRELKMVGETCAIGGCYILVSASLTPGQHW